MKYTFLAALVAVFLFSFSVAAAPTLTKIPPSSLGDILKIKPGNGSGGLPTVIALTSQQSPTVNTAAGLLSIPLYSYSPLAGAAGQVAIGYTLQGAVNLYDAYNQGKMNGQNFWNAIISNLWPPNTVTLPNIGDTIPIDNVCGGGAGKVTAVNKGGGFCDSSAPGADGCLPRTRCLPNQQVKYYQTSSSGTLKYYTYLQTFYTPVSTAPDFQPSVGAPPQISQNQANQLAQKAAEAALSQAAAFKNAAENLLKQMPQGVPNVENITNNDVNNYYQNETINNHDEYINYLTNQYNSATTQEQKNYYADKIAEAERDKSEAEKDQEQQTATSPTLENPEQHIVNFQPFLNLRSLFLTKFPFSIIGNLSSFFGTNFNPVAPSADLDFPPVFGYDFPVIHFSMDIMSPIASVFRLILGWLCFGLTAYVCVIIWRQ